MVEQVDVRIRVKQANPVPESVVAAEARGSYSGVLDMIDERSLLADALPREASSGRRGRAVAPRVATAAFASGFLLVVLVVAIASVWPSVAPSIDTGLAQSPPTSLVPEIDTDPVQSPPTSVALVAPPEEIALSAYPLGDMPGVPYDLTTDGEVLVAVGVDAGGASAWVSRDGRFWEQRALPPVRTDWDGLSFDWSQTSAVTVEVGPNGFLAAGSVLSDAAVWLSADGYEWRRVVSPPLESRKFEEITSVAMGPSGWVAVGQHERDAAVWMSVDGEEWTSIVDRDFIEATMSYVVDSPHGLVAVGMARNVLQGSVGAVWTSEDGSDWNLTLLHDETGFGSIEVAPSGELLAFGLKAVWRSVDGTTWTPINESDSWKYARPTPSPSAAWRDGEVVAVGRGGIWTSDDGGATWERHDLEDPVFRGADASFAGVVEFNGDLVTVGVFGGYGIEWGAAWVAEK